MTLRVGQVVAAPIKRDGKRRYEDARVTWLSKDGRVADVETCGTRRKVERDSFARAFLRPQGTESPPFGIVV